MSLDYLYKVKKKKKPKVKKGKKGSFSKTRNNSTTFVTKVPKMPKGETNIGAVVSKAKKKKGGKSTDIVIRTTSAKFKQKLSISKTTAIKSHPKYLGGDDDDGSGPIVPEVD